MKKIFSIIALGAFIFSGCGNESQTPAETSPADSLSASYLNTAVKTAAWLKSKAITTPNGITWRANPDDPASVYYSLYYGSPGILLYFLELYEVTKDTSYLHTAVRASDDLLAVVSDRKSDFYTKDRTGFSGPENTRSGLYSGVAGIGFAFGEMYKATQEDKYRNGMLECIKVLQDSVKIKEGKATWTTTQDLLCGDAGTGLFLLYAFERTKDSSLLLLACKTGDFLVSKAIKDKEGLKWPMEPSFPRLMPNYAHGTAGVGYFLQRLCQATGYADFCDAANYSVDYLRNSTDSATGFVFHHEGDDSYRGGKCGGPGCVKYDTCIGSKLFYLSWCHGPAGTGRLLYLMKDSVSGVLLRRAAESVMRSGIPENLTEGFWNNLGQCCGSAGVAEHFMQLYRVTKKDEYLVFAKHLAGYIQKNAVEESEGLKFPHAENNRERDVVYAQTGYMTGAAGIGMFFLHMYENEKGMERKVVFPDDPF